MIINKYPLNLLTSLKVLPFLIASPINRDNYRKPGSAPLISPYCAPRPPNMFLPTCQKLFIVLPGIIGMESLSKYNFEIISMDHNKLEQKQYKYLEVNFNLIGGILSRRKQDNSNSYLWSSEFDLHFPISLFSNICGVNGPSISILF